MVYLSFVNFRRGTTILFFVCIVFIFFSCSNNENIKDIKYLVPMNQYNIYVVDSLRYTSVFKPKNNFEVNFFDNYMIGIGSYLKIKHYFSQDSIKFTNCDELISYPTISFMENRFLRHYEGNKDQFFYLKVQNLIGIRESNDHDESYAFYIAWINNPIFIDISNNGIKPKYQETYTDDIDTTTYEVFTSLDIDVFQNMYKDYKGKITQIEIDTIFLPLLYRTSLDYYSAIKLDSFYNGTSISSTNCSRRLKINPKD